MPKAMAYLFGEHTFTHRRLKCPKCGKKGYCRRILTLQEENFEANEEKKANKKTPPSGGVFHYNKFQSIGDKPWLIK